MTLEQFLAGVEGRANEATNGPWSHQGHGEVRADLDAEFTKNIADCGFNSPDSENDGEFIAHSRTDIPRLIAMLRKAIKQRDSLHNEYCQKDDCVPFCNDELMKLAGMG